MSDFKIEYLADKVFVHHWPKDTPVWIDSLQKELDTSINKNSKKKAITVTTNQIQIENYTFTSLQKIGISIPFFKDECTMIFEAQFKQVFAHIHITMKSNNFLDIFNQLISWKNKFHQ